MRIKGVIFEGKGFKLNDLKDKRERVRRSFVIKRFERISVEIRTSFFCAVIQAVVTCLSIHMACIKIVALVGHEERRTKLAQYRIFL